MTKNQTLSRPINLLITGVLTVLSLFVLRASSTHAATFNPVIGNDATNNDSQCNLSEAMQNISDGAQTNNDCVATEDSYGTNDTINLPSGTITLTADLPAITQPLTIKGQGTGVSIIDGGGQWGGIQIFASTGSAIASDFTITSFKNAALLVAATDLDITVNRIEVDGAGAISDNQVVGGVLLATGGSSTVSNTYIHDLISDTDQVNVVGITVAADGGEQNITISNTTISNLSATENNSASAILFMTGVISQTNAPGTIYATLRNNTMSGISSTDSSAAGVAAFSIVEGGDSLIEVTAQNNTITQLSGATSLNVFESGAVVFSGITIGDGDTLTNNFIGTNNVFASVTSDGLPHTCSDYSVGGAITSTITSTGGNLSDDNTCSPYFTQPTDQNNITSLASTLGPLGDYGGYVPTIPLLEGSPAIDAGVTVAGLTSDARGVSRPLGLAYDSGAYESPFTRPTVTRTLANTGENAQMLLMVAGAFVSGSVFVTWRRRVLQ